MSNKILDLIGSLKKHAVIAITLVFLCSIIEGISFGLIMPLLEVVISGKTTSAIGLRVDSFLKYIFGYNSMVIISCLIISLFFLKNFLILFRNYFIYMTEWRMRQNWMHILFTQYLHMDYIKFSSLKQGTMLNNLTNETLNAASGIRQIIELVSQISLAIVFLFILFISNPTITGSLLFLAFLLMYVTRYITRNYTAHVGENKLLLNQGITRTIIETLNGMQTVRTMGLEKVVTNRFSKNLDPMVKLVGNSEVIKRTPTQIFELFFVVLLIGSLIYIENFIDGNLINYLPFLGMFVVISTRLFSNLGSITANSIAIKMQIPAINLIHELIFNAKKIKNSKQGKNFVDLKNRIRFSNISFGYKNDLKVLNKINIDIKKGGSIAVIGPSGSGKTTLFNLLSGILHPQEGRIEIDGVGLDNLDIKSWRKKIGYVSQESFFFNGTILENLLIANPNALKEDIFDSLEKAYCTDFIDFTNEGLQTYIGDRGLTLSGGQKTRLSFARAILAKPQIFLLDEVTASLDHDSEKAVINTIKNIQQSATIFIITHQYSILEIVDLVYKINKKGQIKKLDGKTFD